MGYMRCSITRYLDAFLLSFLKCDGQGVHVKERAKEGMDGIGRIAKAQLICRYERHEKQSETEKLQ